MFTSLCSARPAETPGEEMKSRAHERPAKELPVYWPGTLNPTTTAASQ
jgi:hypothetical protein